MRRRPLRLMLCAAPVALAACSSDSTNETGVRIGDETLGQMKAGVTTEAWLVAILGMPTSWAPVEGVENTKVLRYASVERSGGGLASLLSGSSSRTTSVTYFIVTDGIVTRFWADRAQQYTVLGKKVDEDSGTKSQAKPAN